MSSNNRMTVCHVQKRLQQIYDKRWDDEGAHIAEDELYMDVLKAIAEGRCDDPAACASEALKSDNIDFARWYA